MKKPRKLFSITLPGIVRVADLLDAEKHGHHGTDPIACRLNSTFLENRAKSRFKAPAFFLKRLVSAILRQQFERLQARADRDRIT